MGKGKLILNGKVYNSQIEFREALERDKENWERIKSSQKNTDQNKKSFDELNTPEKVAERQCYKDSKHVLSMKAAFEADPIVRKAAQKVYEIRFGFGNGC